VGDVAYLVQELARAATDERNAGDIATQLAAELTAAENSGGLSPDQLALLRSQAESAAAVHDAAQDRLIRLTSFSEALRRDPPDDAELSTTAAGLAGELLKMRADGAEQARITEVQTAETAALSRLVGEPESWPMALLPVRVETRFAPEGQLLIRVYPDPHTDSFDERLTADEAKWGAQYHDSRGQAGSADDQRAWAHLADRYGPRRAAWIARRSEPGTEVKLRSGAWNRATTAVALPHRWVAIGWQGARRFAAAARYTVAEDLHVGPEPGLTRPPTPPPDTQLAKAAALGVDAGMKWMVDFDEAEKKGWRCALSSATTPKQGLTVCWCSACAPAARKPEQSCCPTSLTTTTSPTDSA
jgi:hypothetical protein